MRLLDFAAELGSPADGKTAPWFAAHPEVRAEVLEGIRAGASRRVVHKWLRAEHGVPFGRSAFQEWLAKETV